MRTRGSEPTPSRKGVVRNVHWQAPEFFDTHCRAVLDWREEYTDTPSGSICICKTLIAAR